MVDRVDLGIVVREVLAQLDEQSIGLVVARVDVDAVAQRLDLDAVARRIDIEAVLDRMDLTTTVLRRVDLRVVVDAVLAQVDLIGLAEQVIDGVDLPEIIRESTGSMASETVKGVRMQGIGADQAVEPGDGPPAPAARAPARRREREAPVAAGAVTGDGPTGDGADDHGPNHHGPNGRRAQPPRGGRRCLPIPREARPYQGQRAGLVTRLVAASLDTIVVGAGPGRRLPRPGRPALPDRPAGLPVPARSASSSACSGRSCVAVRLPDGGLDVERSHLRLPGDGPAGARPGRPEAAASLGAASRAVFVVLVPIGIAWVLVSRDNRSLQDLVLGTRVVYDWQPRGADPQRPFRPP